VILKLPSNLSFVRPLFRPNYTITEELESVREGILEERHITDYDRQAEQQKFIFIAHGTRAINLQAVSLMSPIKLSY